MGREIRMVPPNFEHPKELQFRHAFAGNPSEWVDDYIPLYDGLEYEEDAIQWVKEYKEFDGKDEGEYYFNIERPPFREDYTDVKKEDCTWFQLYETVSEGTPLSPPFETKEELINYLVENGDFWHQRYPNSNLYRKKPSYEAAKKFVEEMWAPSFVIEDGCIKEGINVYEKNS